MYLLSKFVKINNNVTEASFKISQMLKDNELLTKQSKAISGKEFIKTVLLKSVDRLQFCEVVVNLKVLKIHLKIYFRYDRFSS